MRLPNDLILAESVAGIDFIFGGHDHFYHTVEVQNCHVIKSGTDFREFSHVKVCDEPGGFAFFFTFFSLED